MSPGDGGLKMAPTLIAMACNKLYAADCASMDLKMYKKKTKEWAVIGRLPEIVHNMDS
ncbi:hypothetical protein Hanom_Chr07g00604391 [Helianthus anomalus]